MRRTTGSFVPSRAPWTSAYFRLDRSRTISYSPRQSVNFDTIGEYHMPDGRATYKNLKIALINRDETLTLLAAHLQTSIPQVHRIVVRCHGKTADQLTAT